MKFRDYILSEEKINSKVKQVTKEFMQALKNEDDPFFSYVTIEGEEIEIGLTWDYDPEPGRTFEVSGGTWADGTVVDINVSFTKELMPQLLNKILPELKGVIAHELEHVKQIFNPNKTKVIDHKTYIKAGDKYDEYFLNKAEMEAFWVGFHKQAKTSKRPIDDIAMEVLNAVGLKNRAKVEKIWMDYGKKKYPNAVWRKK